VYIIDAASFLPEAIVDNHYFAARTGRAAEWFSRVTGIRERRRTTGGMDINELSLRAVAPLAERDGERLTGVDYIIGCSYTPSDTIGTIAHVVQRQFHLVHARAVLISSACSSVLNGMELAAALFESGRARRILLVAAEHNSLYARDEDPQSGHLWGDGAAAMLLGAEPGGATPGSMFDVLDLVTAAHGHLGSGPDAVSMRARAGGLTMPHGREVFHHACQQMAAASRKLLDRCQIGIASVKLFVAHQANRRIMNHVAGDLGLSDEQVASTIETCGNTGCASSLITLIEHRQRLKSGDLALMAVFGGGYSSGAALLRAR
jgi:3-oxoacyl-[acyl-carrier-protein] synthase-3